MRFEQMIKPQDVGFIAAGIVIGAIAVVAVQASCEVDVRVRSPSLWTGPLYPASATDPLAEELSRCRDLPPEKADDPACRELWATQRRKFLEPRKASGGEARPVDLFPAVPKSSEPAAGSRASTPKSE
jgi:conjugative transfer region protein TrbK